jgi:hypothetical protein
VRPLSRDRGAGRLACDCWRGAGAGRYARGCAARGADQLLTCGGRESTRGVTTGAGRYAVRGADQLLTCGGRESTRGVTTGAGRYAVRGADQLLTCGGRESTRGVATGAGRYAVRGCAVRDTGSARRQSIAGFRPDAEY